MFELRSCLKGTTTDLDKARAPEETVRSIREICAHFGQELLERTARVDTGRLGIPVYMAMCGPRAKAIMPTRKQMGKGASPAQAEASAMMEFIERYSLFAFLHPDSTSSLPRLTWSQAKARFGNQLLPIQEILHSVQEERPTSEAVQIMDLVSWSFCPAYDLHGHTEVVLPLDWFRTINEFNGSSAGNTPVESALQGLCELVERHVCALIDRDRPILPSIALDSLQNPVLRSLVDSFARQGIQLWLKDFSLGMGIPTVGALAYDPKTFPDKSEIVFTAGTATSASKAAIRAITEVAQLAGDFETCSCYEPSGLSKFHCLQDCSWVMDGPLVPLSSLPDISHPDMSVELQKVAHTLRSQGFSSYVVDTTQPDMAIPAHYSLVPGFAFRERTHPASLGLFAGRILAEQAPENEAREGLNLLEHLYPKAHFLPFFQGLLALRLGQNAKAHQAFVQAEPAQPTVLDQGFAAFYQAYSLGQEGDWDLAEQALNRAIELAPDVHAFYNLRGVRFFQAKDYERAIADFQAALRLDPGSVMDLANLGVCLKRNGRLQEAEHYLQTSLDMDPGLEGVRAELEDLLGRDENQRSGLPD